MYNSITEEKIKRIPQIGDIDTERLPQELTKIFAQIVGLRRKLIDGSINFQEQDLLNSLQILQTLAINLETILLSEPRHDNKESIAFVAGTAQSLIYQIKLSIGSNSVPLLEIDTISPVISAVLLFLIGNSQADAAEMADKLIKLGELSPTQIRLVRYIHALAKGNLSSIFEDKFQEEEIVATLLQARALDYLWRELGLGVNNIASKLSKNTKQSQDLNHFDRVIDLCVSENILNQRSVFTGPFHLAKLLKLLEQDILDRAVIDIPAPNGVDPFKWGSFLEKLAQKRPYLWENHKSSVDTNFLDLGISAVLTLPTGAGKTTLSELKIASCLFSNKNVLYLVPTHALKDQVSKNFRELFIEFTHEELEFDGEFTEFSNTDAFPILVMTPERCITLLNTNPDLFQTIGLIVFDEFHLIHGTNIKKDRRAIDAMYCLISLLTINSTADYLLISAMVENGAEITEWIQQITGRTCKLYNSSWKPTRQLHGCLIFEEEKLKLLEKKVTLAKFSKKTKSPSKKLRDELGISPICFFSLRNIWETSNDNDYHSIRLLDNNVLLGINDYWRITTNRNVIAAKLGSHFSNLGLKTLIFVDDPKVAQSTLKKLGEGLVDRSNSYNQFVLDHQPILNSLELELGSIEHSYFHNQTDIGVHHGLLLPLERDLIEQYFKKPDGAIALIATATLAQGINLPAEIVIIAGDDRFDEETGKRERIPPHEILNAAGRAGRAGQSSQGAVILIPGEIVTIKDLTISDRWWDLKSKVFSKSDQCLKIEDPLQYFLDSLQAQSVSLDLNQTNVLFKFKSEKLSENDTKKLLGNSFYAFKAFKENKQETFSAQVESLIQRRNELDDLSDDIVWIKEISYKTGIDPSFILLLGYEVDKIKLEEFLKFTIVEIIDWFYILLKNNSIFINKIYYKGSTITQIKKVIGIKFESNDYSEISDKIDLLKSILIQYVKGEPLSNINRMLSGKDDFCLTKARNFVVRLVPELSFGFGLLTMIIIEQAKQKGIDKTNLPWTIRALATCIREGFDEPDKLFYKRNHKLRTRVETHVSFSNQQN